MKNEHINSFTTADRNVCDLHYHRRDPDSHKSTDTGESGDYFKSSDQIVTAGDDFYQYGKRSGSADVFSSLSILGIAAVMYVCLLILGTLSGKVFRLQGEHLQRYRAMTVFGNVGFMGIPIVVSIYPEKGMLYMAVFTIIDQLMLWTLGVKLTSSEKEGGVFNPKKLINPVTVAIILALICVLTGIRIPLVLNTALQKMGATATPLAMIYLGGVFACIDVLSFIRKPDYYGITLIKMLVFPVLFYILLGFVHIPADIRMTMALTSAMPVMSSVVMMANASGSDGDYAMGGIVVTTLCSVLTLPVVSWIFQVLG